MVEYEEFEKSDSISLDNEESGVKIQKKENFEEYNKTDLKKSLSLSMRTGNTISKSTRSATGKLSKISLAQSKLRGEKKREIKSKLKRRRGPRGQKIDNCIKDKDQKSFLCKFPNCGKIFLDSSSLRKHAMNHGEKQYICPVEGCGKRFLDNSKLKRHNLVHTGEKAYQCEICGKRFSLDFNLRTHLRTHTGEKPYLCKFPNCTKKFTQSSNLAAHEKTHFIKEKTLEQRPFRSYFPLSDQNTHKKIPAFSIIRISKISENNILSEKILTEPENCEIEAKIITNNSSVEKGTNCEILHNYLNMISDSNPKINETDNPYSIFLEKHLPLQNEIKALIHSIENYHSGFKAFKHFFIQ